MEKRIVYLSPANLRAHPQNARVHPKRQIQRIAESIKRFGFTNPILVNADNRVLAGHARWEAAQLLRLATVPTIRIDGLSAAAQRAFVLADNKLTELAGWDRATLAVELRDLAPLLTEAGLDIEITGFQTAEIDALLGDLVDSEHDPADDPYPLAEKAVSRPGDLWLLGNHRLLCGDAREAADLERLMGGQRAALVITDPPYNARVRGVQGRGKIKHREFVTASGEMSRDQFTRFLSQCFALAAKHSVKGSVHFVSIDWRHIREMLDAGDEVYSELKNLIVWNKTNAGLGSFYRSQHELIFVWKNGEAPHINNFELGQHGRNRTNIWTYPGVNTFGSDRLKDLAIHPTVKPVALFADAIRDCSRRGDVVLDPFVGSGTTVLAAERIGRRAHVLDLDPLYVDASVRRWQAFCKRDAVLDGTEMTFDAVVTARALRRHGRRR